MKALNTTLMRAVVYVALLIAGLFGSAGIAVAQEPTPDQQSAIRSNCRSDFMANCSGVPRGGKEALQCLKDNVAKLSSGCQQVVKAVMPAPAPKTPAPSVTATPAAPVAPPPAATPAAPVAATPAAPAAPAAPATSTATQAAAKPAAPVASTPQAAAKPASVKPAAPAKSAAKPPASAPVPAAAPPAVIMVAPHQVFVLVRTKCRAEYRAYCSDVDIGGGRVVACLQSNAASLSPTCQSGLAELGR
jgi:hypothetical protein